MTQTIEINDWIKIEEPHRMRTYSEAHVIGKTKSGNLKIAYGSRNESSYTWLYMGGDQEINPRYISEIWRKTNGTWILQ